MTIDRPVLLAGLFFAGDLFFWHLAILGTTVANATFLATTAPIWVAFGAWLLTRETIGLRTILGLALCLSGGAALLGQSYGFAPERLSGDLFGLATAVFFGGYVLAVRTARQRHGAGRMIFLSTVVTAACLFVVAIAARAAAAAAIGQRPCGAGRARGRLAGRRSGPGGDRARHAAGDLLVARHLHRSDCGRRVSPGSSSGEALGPVQVLGGVLILVGIWVARPRSRRQHRRGRAMSASAHFLERPVPHRRRGRASGQPACRPICRRRPRAGASSSSPPARRPAR